MQTHRVKPITIPLPHLQTVGGAAAALALMVVTASVMAFGVNHGNRLTFNRPVALPGVVLPAGTYSFNVADEKARCRDRAQQRRHGGALPGVHDSTASTGRNVADYSRDGW
jgi:hypothetical protein